MDKKEEIPDGVLGEIIKTISPKNTPNFVLEHLPAFRIKKVAVKNLKTFEDCEFRFDDNNFVCFVGPNGTGKSTSLEIMQLICSRFDGSEDERLKAYLGRSVRQTGGRKIGVVSDGDFQITADIEYEHGDYQIILNKRGFVKDHPPEVKEILYRLCYFSTFDKELHKFQLKAEKWPVFKELFETITGYTITQEDAISNLSNMIGSYGIMQPEISTDTHVWSFWVNKTNETVSHKDCSDGERKVIKSLVSLLNRDYVPRIILIDNIEMHVETRRHLPLVDALKRTFPESQIFATTHSSQIIKNFGMQKEIYDLRWLHASEIVCSEPWRLFVADEVWEFVAKAECLSDKEKGKLLSEKGIHIKNCLLQTVDNSGLIEEARNFLKEVEEEFFNDMLCLKTGQKIVNCSKNFKPN